MEKQLIWPTSAIQFKSLMYATSDGDKKARHKDK